VTGCGKPSDQLATAVLVDAVDPLDDPELDDPESEEELEPLSDLAGSLAVVEPPRLSVR
jgi:hypothetical protein